MPKQTEEGTAFTRTHHIVRKTTLYDMDIDPTRKYAVIGCQDRSIRFVLFSFWNVVIDSSSSFIIILSFVHLLVEPVFQENPGSYYANVFVNVFLYLNLHQCFSFCNLIISRYLDSFEVMTVYRQLLYIYISRPHLTGVTVSCSRTHCSQR